MRIHIFDFAILIFAMGFLGCHQKDAEQNRRKSRTTPVIVEAVVREAVAESLSLVGTIEANERVEIKAETLGIVESILFEEGQDVEAGDVLIALDRTKLEAAYEESIANLKLSEAELQRSGQLFKDRLVSQQEFDQAATRAQSDRAVMTLRQRQLQDAKVIAPFAGVVGSRNVSPGQVITRDQTLTWLVDLDPLRVRFFVPERFLQVAQKGQNISLQVAAFPDRHFEGEVYFVAPFVDPQTRNVEVKALIPNQNRLLIPGMFANLQLTLTIRNRALVISEMALFRTLEGNQAIVYVVDENNLAQTKQVKIGERMPGKVEVIRGLNEGDRVIVEGTQKIGPGAPVIPSSTNSEMKTKSQNPDSQNPNSRNSDSRNSESQNPNSNSPESNSRKSDSQKSESRNSNSRNSNSPESDSQNSDSDSDSDSLESSNPDSRNLDSSESQNPNSNSSNSNSQKSDLRNSNSPESNSRKSNSQNSDSSNSDSSESNSRDSNSVELESLQTLDLLVVDLRQSSFQIEN